MANARFHDVFIVQITMQEGPTCELNTAYKSSLANAEANGLTTAQADVRELRWGEDADLPDCELLRVDVVLMSDVFYDPEEMPAMAATLRRLWRDGTVGWAASEVRCGVQDCVDVLREHGFDVAEVDRVTRPLLRDPTQASDFAVYRVELWRPH
ncbi:hypothetical protein TRIUR3_30074 [Triticum urartu]|uniref:Uncharacterized protein n=2 Tax=Triticum TaxID=4564 RepID=M8A7T9_TRIUA|nr:hypothetical protein TRIUR3_30074 [Triticum urartu]